jgi:hypothetical protein
MAMSDLTFVKGQNALGRKLPGEDYISGFLTYTSSLPSGFSSTNRVKAVNSVAEAESLGILGDYSDATAAVGSVQITTAGTDGDTLEIKVADIDTLSNTRTTSLGVYTKVTGDSTAALVATAVAAIINAGTINHGYSASVSTATISITAPKRLGIYLNTGSPITTTIVGSTIAATVTQFSAGTPGTYSKLAVYHYHVAEYFRACPNGQLWLGFFGVPGSYTYSEITTMQDATGGKMRQVAIFKNTTLSSISELTTINSICVANDPLKQPLSAFFTWNMAATSDITTLGDLATLTANKASAVIGQDGGGLGNYLFLTTGISISQLGCLLGTVASLNVNQSAAWVGGANLSDGYENEVLAFANGKKFSELSGSLAGILTGLDSKRYIFARKLRNKSGSWFNSDHAAIVSSSDYAYIKDNRTIDKAIRLIYGGKLTDDLNGEVMLRSNGYLSAPQQAVFEGHVSESISQMVAAGEISDFAVTVNPDQDVLGTSTLVVGVRILPTATARWITVNISFTRSI